MNPDHVLTDAEASRFRELSTRRQVDLSEGEREELRQLSLTLRERRYRNEVRARAARLAVASQLYRRAARASQQAAELERAAELMPESYERDEVEQRVHREDLLATIALAGVAFSLRDDGVASALFHQEGAASIREEPFGAAEELSIDDYQEGPDGG